MIWKDASAADLIAIWGFLLSCLCTAEHNTKHLSQHSKVILTGKAEPHLRCTASSAEVGNLLPGLTVLSEKPVCTSPLIHLACHFEALREHSVTCEIERKLWNQNQVLFLRDTQCWQKYTPEEFNVAFFGFLARFLSCISKWKMSMGNSWQ